MKWIELNTTKALMMSMLIFSPSAYACGYGGGIVEMLFLYFTAGCALVGLAVAVFTRLWVGVKTAGIIWGSGIGIFVVIVLSMMLGN